MAANPPSCRSSIGPLREAVTATRPPRSPSSTPATPESSSHSTHVVGVPSGESDPGRCQSLPPTAIAAGSHACHHDSGVVQVGSSQDQCQTSSSGGGRSIGGSQLPPPPNGWLIDISPPARSAAASHESAAVLKSIHPVSPSTPA